jgi:hypothetical protein
MDRVSGRGGSGDLIRPLGLGRNARLERSCYTRIGIST